VTRLPIRWKVALAFAATSAIVLAGLGAFLYARFELDLTETLDRGLAARADEVVAAVERSPDGLARPDPSALEDDESVAQVLRADGTTVAATTGAGAALLTPRQRERALRAPLTVDREGDALLDEGSRLRAVPVTARGERLVAVVGASLDERDENLRSLLIAEAIGIALALALISGGGYVVSGLVLRPEREALARERRFVADASHELRTPLTILRSEVEVALLEESTIDGLHAALRSVGEEAERLTALTEDLLVLAQVDDGRLPIRPEPVEVAALLAGIARRRWPGTVRVADAGDLVVQADRLRLEQALTNLVDNAVRHGAGAVELAAARAGDAVVLTVRDHGPGLPERFPARAFERFSRADQGRSGGGAGLGLAIVRAVVEAHGGSISLGDAQPGTIATIRLPHRPLIQPPAPSRS